MNLVFSALFLAVLLALSAFFSATEVAFLSVSRIKVHLFLSQGLRGAESLRRLKANSQREVITILIASNIVNVAASVMAAGLFLELFGSDGLGIATGVMTLLILTFGDIIPKSLATTHAEKWILRTAFIVVLLEKIFFPLIFFFEILLRSLPAYAVPTRVKAFTEEEIRGAIALGVQDKAITLEEKKMLENVLLFNDASVKDVLRAPRFCVTLNAGQSVAEALKKALASSYSRFPVLSNEGKPVGIISVKRLAGSLPDAVVGAVMRQPLLLKPEMKANEAFKLLQQEGRNMALVTNDAGDFLGLVSLEDLLEEIVGELP